MEFLQPQDVAEVVAFLAAQPKHVNLQQVVVMPTRQAT
jgi:NADP-dependent 3-hydroxy acid dehydrogenase YdfG